MSIEYKVREVKMELKFRVIFWIYLSILALALIGFVFVYYGTEKHKNTILETE
jgi:hypothetical protein